MPVTRRWEERRAETEWRSLPEERADPYGKRRGQHLERKEERAYVYLRIQAYAYTQKKIDESCP